MTREGPIEVRNEDVGGAVRAVATAVRRVPLESVWRAATDYEHYTEFMPRTCEAVVERRTEREVVFRTALDFVLKKVRYRLRLQLDRAAGHVSWTLLDGDLRRCEGSWQLDDLGQGLTRITYTSLVESAIPVPKRIEAGLLGKSLPEVVEKTVERARRLSA